jgi:hypothetical protein
MALTVKRRSGMADCGHLLGKRKQPKSAQATLFVSKMISYAAHMAP